MGYFPFYMDIEGKLCVIAGGGKVAYRKVCDLLPFGATIKVVSPEWNAGLSALAEEPSFGSRLKLYRRLFSVEDDLADADFVIAASSDKVLNAKISDYCRQKKIPVNVVDVICKINDTMLHCILQYLLFFYVQLHTKILFDFNMLFYLCR